MRRYKPGYYPNKTSKYTGVTRFNGKFIARITYRGKVRRLGNFLNEDEAARAYNRVARTLGRPLNAVKAIEDDNDDSMERVEATDEEDCGEEITGTTSLGQGGKMGRRDDDRREHCDDDDRYVEREEKEGKYSAEIVGEETCGHSLQRVKGKSLEVLAEKDGVRARSENTKQDLGHEERDNGDLFFDDDDGISTSDDEEMTSIEDGINDEGCAGIRKESRTVKEYSKGKKQKKRPRTSAPKRKKGIARASGKKKPRRSPGGRKKGRKTSRYIGVSRKGQEWLSRISFDGQNIILGVFETEIEAARAYNELAVTVNRPVNNIPDDPPLESAAKASTHTGEKATTLSLRAAIMKEEQEKQRQWRQRVWNPLLESKKNLTTPEKLSQLTDMGFDLECSTLALAECRGNVERASNYLARQMQRLKSTGVRKGGGGGGGDLTGERTRSNSSSSRNINNSKHTGGTTTTTTNRIRSSSNSSSSSRTTNHGKRIVLSDDDDDADDERGGLKDKSRDRRLSWNRFFHGMDDHARERIQELLEKNAVDSIEVLRECETSDFIEMGMLIGDKKRVLKALRDFPQ